MCVWQYVQANLVCLTWLWNWLLVDLEWGSEREVKICMHKHRHPHTHAHTSRVFSKAVQSYAPADTCVILDSLLFLNRRTCAVTDRQILWVLSMILDCGEVRGHDSTDKDTQREWKRKSVREALELTWITKQLLSQLTVCLSEGGWGSAKNDYLLNQQKIALLY